MNRRRLNRNCSSIGSRASPSLDYAHSGDLDVYFTDALRVLYVRGLLRSSITLPQRVITTSSFPLTLRSVGLSTFVDGAQEGS